MIHRYDNKGQNYIFCPFLVQKIINLKKLEVENGRICKR
nr:MAG TPA: hypothetical protein [Bacteriophage sp.]